MDWDSIRQQWQAQAAGASEPAPGVEQLRRESDRLQRTIRRRDRLETIAAVVVAVFFLLAAGGEFSRGGWVGGGFALLLVAWAVFVPFRLRRARQALPEPRPDLPLRLYLQRQREAALVQARMLERAWLWYVAPCMVGLLGLTFSVPGSGTGRLVYGAFVVALGILVAWINRRAARQVFRGHARALQQQIESLDGAGAGPCEPSINSEGRTP